MIKPHGTDLHSLTGAILAGGLSTRMGRDKATLIMADGRTMIEHVIDALKPLCAQIVIVGPAMPNAPRELRVINDLRPHCGPLGGIEAVLASGVGREYLVCPCDAPLINTETLRLLLPPPSNACGFASATVFRLPGRERFECLPLRINADALAVVREHLDRNEFALWRMIQALDPQIIEIDETQAALLRNVNTPEEFRTIAGHAII